MYLEWMGKNRAFVEKFIRYANTYAAVYKKEALYGTDIPISFEQVQVLEYLLENEQLNQNMSMIASRLGITPSNFTRIVNKLSGKNFKESRLTGTVGTDQTIAVSLGKFDVYILKEGLLADS